MNKTNKPLSEWTLKEVQNYCLGRSTMCDGCQFMGIHCSGDPTGWTLDDQSCSKDTNVADKPAKPRLAEVLGVEVGEQFHLPDNGGTRTFWVNDRGYFETDPPQLTGSTYLLLDAINHPESIIRVPQLTEAELTICKAVDAKWVSRGTLGSKTVVLWDAMPECFDDGTFGSTDTAHKLARIYAGFESVHPGDCICVEEAGK